MKEFKMDIEFPTLKYNQVRDGIPTTLLYNYCWPGHPPAFALPAESG